MNVKLASGREFAIPFDKFAPESQTVIKTWAENNKGKLDRNSVFVSITEESKAGKREKVEAGGKGWKKGKDGYTRDSSTKFKIRVQNRNNTEYENVQIAYTIYKETRKRGFGGKGTDVSEDTIDGTLDIASLKGKAEEILETEEVTTRDSVKPGQAQKNKRAEDQEIKEKVDGIVVKVMHEGNEVLVVSNPPSLYQTILRKEAQNR